MNWQYREWHDADNAVEACYCNQQQADTLVRCPPLQEELGARADEEIRIIADLLEQAERELDVNIFWFQYNECARRAFRPALPRLRRAKNM